MLSFTNHLVEMWHHFMLTHGNIVLWHVAPYICFHVSTHCYVIKWYVPTYGLFTPYVHTYTYTKIYIIYTTKYTNSCTQVTWVKPKTSWRPPNALATELHNSLLVKFVQCFLLSCYLWNSLEIPTLAYLFYFEFFSVEANKCIIL
jgi:hypothetical protein